MTHSTRRPRDGLAAALLICAIISLSFSTFSKAVELSGTMMTKNRLHCVPFAAACVTSCLFLLVRSSDAFVARTTRTTPTVRSSPATVTASLLKASTAAAQDEELLHRALLDRRLGLVGNQNSVSLNEVKTKAPADGGISNNKGDDATAYVGNLSYSATEEQVRELFETYGTVKRIYMPTDKETGNFRGFGFITLGSREEMLAATKALDQSSYLGRIIYSNESVPKGEPLASRKEDVVESKLYVSNIAFETTKEDLRTHFGRWGTVFDVYIPVDRDTGNSRGFAFVKLAEEDAKQALEEGNGSELNGRTLSVSTPLPRGQKSARPERKRSTKLYVGNLSFDEDTESVRSLFNGYGDVMDCYMPLDRDTGRSRGFAFVTLDADAAMRAADETDGYEWNGRVLRVNEAQPKNTGEEVQSAEVDFGYDDGSGDGDWGDDDE